MKRRKLSNKTKGKLLIFSGILGVLGIFLIIFFSCFNFKAFGYMIKSYFAAAIENGVHIVILTILLLWLILILMREFIDHVVPMLIFFIGKPFKYLAVWRICRKKGYACRFRRAPFVSLKGIENCPDIEVQMGEKKVCIHFVDVPFPVLRMFFLINDREYRMHRSVPGKFRQIGFSVRPGEREMDKDHYDAYEIPEFPPKGAEVHYLVIDLSCADAFFIDHKSMFSVTGECTVGNVVTCKWKILKKRIKDDLYATT